MSKQTTRVKIVTSLNRRYHGKFCAMRIGPIHRLTGYFIWNFEKKFVTISRFLNFLFSG